MTMTRSTFLTMLFALSGAVWAPIALAETDDSTPPSAASEQAATPYSDAELKSFAVALLKVDHYLKESAKQKSPDQTTPDEMSPDDESSDQKAPIKPKGSKKAEQV